MKNKFKTGDLVYAIHFREMGVGIVIEPIDYDMVGVYWCTDGIVMSSGLQSIAKVEANENKV